MTILAARVLRCPLEFWKIYVFHLAGGMDVFCECCVQANLRTGPISRPGESCPVCFPVFFKNVHIKVYETVILCIISCMCGS